MVVSSASTCKRRIVKILVLLWLLSCADLKSLVFANSDTCAWTQPMLNEEICLNIHSSAIHDVL